MKITNPLDNVLNSDNKIKILRFMVMSKAEWNGRQISRELGGSPTTIHKALQNLRDEGILSLNNIGNTYVYSLNLSNRILLDILIPLFEKESKLLSDIIVLIKKGITASKIRESILSAGIFGSVKTGRDHAGSDIDIFVIIETYKERIVIEELFESIGVNVTKEYGNVLSAYINTEKEFKSKYAKGLPVIKNIIKSHSIIYGKKLEDFI
ncbi:nucleotidyltransferase [Candidatus Omnitrophus magneticus]|uniref:Nucleotidyltransferase n=1 Tax=Candidatus Omnitrophus magneticus TaxID=1609969 RepID=A0A0F0CPA8_9BACT|nr:nucleotidyltransferase [Candidatus Omnitrophus magneticus]